MKVTQSDLEALEAAIFETLEVHDLEPHQVQSTALAWEVFYKTREDGRLHLSLDELYERYDDSHLETAFKRIFRL